MNIENCEKKHVIDNQGRVVFNRLWDDGSSVLRFDSGYGFLVKGELSRPVYSYSVRDGWA